MKQLKIFVALLLCIFISKKIIAQDVLINIISQNSGVVNKKQTAYLEITICNKSFTTNVPVYKLKPQISFPSNLVSVADTGHLLPSGWSIIDNTNSVIKISNGTDEIPPSTCRTILIAMQGKNTGGPSTITGNLMFANGQAPGKLAGVATIGDNAADNSSTTTIKTIQ